MQGWRGLVVPEPWVPSLPRAFKEESPGPHAGWGSLDARIEQVLPTRATGYAGNLAPRDTRRPGLRLRVPAFAGPCCRHPWPALGDVFLMTMQVGQDNGEPIP